METDAKKTARLSSVSTSVRNGGAGIAPKGVIIRLLGGRLPTHDSEYRSSVGE